MTTTTASAPALRRLYLVRFAFALVWAGSLFATASGIGPVSGALLVLYPLFDVAAAVVDARSSRAAGSARGLHLNIAISSLAAVGLAVAVTSGGVPAVLRAWGIWAVASGAVQLVVGVGRRELGGQWAMIASGGLSTLAGTAFFLQASGDGATLTTLAGYALVGGVFFLVSALRLGRTADEG
ncbi:hypothetical protein [Saccharothrix yanglingensis]|uniref:Integral membrane protein n=1 Tax=Saccharothrix yanglingensis TaxID=659496 RepID=A0ABU0X4T9_9PSEU|nr:hypothetical protein [Saccharothrix yanglingensis]MDQ2587031.1 hypothetical protein [Saccharothrix yanglingensis]